MPYSRTPYEEPESLRVEIEEPSRSDPRASMHRPSPPIADETWDVFELDEDTIEPEPEYGDFWGELDDDETI
jgi:hypothetical protein